MRRQESWPGRVHFFNAGGLQLMGWLTGSEIYPPAVRGAGSSEQAATLWTTNLLITLSLLSITNRVGIGPTMWLYGAFNVAAWLPARIADFRCSDDQ